MVFKAGADESFVNDVKKSLLAHGFRSAEQSPETLRVNNAGEILVEEVFEEL
tara:strand:+ start:183 stop:338 length:156 start_codon:yes stop_codon:yes gene_type:complete